MSSTPLYLVTVNNTPEKGKDLIKELGTPSAEILFQAGSLLHIANCESKSNSSFPLPSEKLLTFEQHG
jgi:hypothetical protein